MKYVSNQKREHNPVWGIYFDRLVHSRGRDHVFPSADVLATDLQAQAKDN